MTESTELQVQMIEIDKIGIPEERIRSVLEEETMIELENSIKDVGILQPVQCLEVDGSIILLDGYHRLLVSKKLGKLKVPAIVRPGKPSEILIHNFIMNRQRGKSDPVGEGLVLKSLIDEHNLTQQEAADKCGISKGWASKLLKIQRLDPYVLNHIREGKLSVASAFHIAQLDDIQERRQLAEDAISWNYSEQQTKERVKILINPDVPLEEQQFDYSPSGRPEIIYPRCWSCEDELKTAEKILRFCIPCYDNLNAAKMDHSHPPPQEPPPQEPPQFTPQQPQYQQPAYNQCQHLRVVRTQQNEIICLDCRQML